MKKVLKVIETEAGKRLDLWLCEKMKPLSRNRVKKLLDGGKITISGKRVYIAGWKLKANDTVEVVDEQEKSSSFIHIIYEDKDIIVADKPAGILAVPQEKSSKPNFTEQVMGYLRRKYKVGSYLKPIHRLDAETSGVMVFAKSKIGEKLEEDFYNHRINRRYLAVVEGSIEGESGRISKPLEKGDFGGGKKVRAAVKGKPAITEYLVKERYPNATLVEISVQTGRTHQIRVHLSEKGHPIIGDKLYGSKQSFPRHALHAHTLGIRHPSTGKSMRFTSPIPKDFQELVDKLRGIR